MQRIPAVLFALLFIMMSCHSTPEKQRDAKAISPPGKKLHVGFLIVQGVYNSELVAPMDIFHHTIFHTDPAMEVFTIAPSRETCRWRKIV